MKRWSQLMVIASAVTVMGIFTGCASKEAAPATTEATEVETTQQDTTVNDTTVKQPETIDERELVSTDFPYGNPVVDIRRMVEDFGSLIGETDDKTVFLLGEGTPIKEEDGTISSRQYEMKVLDAETVTDVMYNESKVVGVQLVLNEADMENCQKKLEESFGSAGTKAETTNDGSIIQSVSWEVSGHSVELLLAYGTVSIQITEI